MAAQPGTGDPSSDGDFRERLVERGINPLGAGVAAVGLLLILGAFSSFNWFRDGPGPFFGGASSSTRFGQVRAVLDAFASYVHSRNLAGYISSGTSKTYFDWLAWVLLLVAVGASVAAVTDLGRRHGLFKWLGAVAGVAGIAVTFLALQIVTVQGNAPSGARPPTYGEFIRQSGPGAWAAIAGFALLALASLLPHRD